MTAWWIAVLAGCGGVVLGVLVQAVLAGSRGATGRRGLPIAPGPQLPAGTSEVLDVLRVAAAVLDVATSVVSANPAAYAFGLVRGRDLVHARLRELAVDCRSRGEVRECDLELARGPLGHGLMPVHVLAAPLSGHHVLVLVEDGTEARRVEEVRRDFVANVSHELKTPIGALRLLAEAVHEAAGDSEAVRRFAGRMQQESLRLSALVQELIDLSRLQAADAVHSPEPVVISEVVGEAVDRSRLGADAKRIDVVVGGVDGAVVSGDHALLVTAVRNLIDNAIAYSSEDTRIGIGLRRHEDIVEIAVSDQGIGIAAAEQERIFERFYRVDPARSRATGGTGLGLSIVKHVAANHGGEVTVWSVEGHGSTFTLRLPESAVRPAGPEPRAAEPKGATA